MCRLCHSAAVGRPALVERSTVARAEREVERKFVVGEGFVLPALDVAGLRARPLDIQRIRSTYLDTSDLRLLRAGVTLRRRSGGERGWQLKLPVIGEPGRQDPRSVARDELHAPDARAVPDELARLVRGVAAGHPLGVVATLDTRRRPVALHAADDELAGLVVDDEVTYAARGHSGRFREVEVEDHGGGALLDAVVDRLVAAGARPGTGETKLARALGLPTRAPLLSLDGGAAGPRIADAGRASAGTVAAALVRGSAEMLVQLDIAVRRGRPDALHQFRVACRRLRTLLGALEGVLSDPLHESTGPSSLDPLSGAAGAAAGSVLHLGTLVEELRWMAGELGAARDLEVLEGRLLAAACALPPDLAAAARATLEPALGAVRAAAQRRAEEAMESPRYFAALEALAARADAPAVGAEAALPAAAVFGPLLADAWRRFARRVRAARRAGETSEEEAARLHRARIAAKRVRYLAEAFEPVLGSPARALRRAAAEAQEVLGRYHDAGAGVSLLRSLASPAGGNGTRPPGPPAGAEEPLSRFALGAVAGVLVREAANDRALFLRYWPKVRRRARRAARQLGG